MLTITDSAGVEWTVFEVKRQALGSPTYLPSGFSGGWLCFESATEKRRLASVPDDWLHLEEQQLLDLLQRAKKVDRRYLGATSAGLATPETGEADIEA